MLFWFFYVTLYWRHRGLFNEEGRYFDESSLVVYHEQNAALIVPALGFLLLACALGYGWWIRRRAMGHHTP